MPSSLLITPPPDRPLTPEQRKFNQLVRKIEQVRAELLAWQEQGALFAQGHAQRIRPLLAQIGVHQRTMATRLDGLLAGKGWTKTERTVMRQIVCDLTMGLLDDERLDPSQAAELKALYDKHADTDYDTDNLESVAAMKELFEAVAGVDLGDEAFESEEALMRHAHERLAANAQAHEAAAAQAKAGRRKRPAQLKREQEKQDSAQSLREVYRKLASALHPDRADDDADRIARTALMQRVNQAYEASDLLALFALQLEIEQVDAEHLQRATAERAKHYNRVLSDQLSQLQDEVDARRLGLCMEFGLDPYHNIAPSRLGGLLEREVREFRAAVAEAERDLRTLDDPAATKRWLKRVRQEQMQDDDIPW